MCVKLNNNILEYIYVTSRNLHLIFLCYIEVVLNYLFQLLINNGNNGNGTFASSSSIHLPVSLRVSPISPLQLILMNIYSY